MLDYTDDEYDEYNLSLDADLLPYLAELPPSPDGAVVDGPSSQPEASRPRPISTHSEFSDYDFSEFTAAELASFDAQLDWRSPPTSSAKLWGGNAQVQTSAATSKSHAGTSSGPAVEIELEEPPTNHPAHLKAKGQTFAPRASSSTDPGTAAAGHHGSPKYTAASAFHRWRRSNQLLSVSDLVGPAWCEVQFWYGLLGKRSRKVEERPASFITDTGKTIKVDKATSLKMEKTQERGQVIHKKLEKEIHPVQIKVEITTNEERWGLRIVRMINAIESLVAIGKCREMPVFGILQGQIIVGIIDEIERKPIALHEQESPWESSSESPSSSGVDRKRSRPTASVPVSPSKRNAKKARRTPSPPQTSITAFFSSSSVHSDHGAEQPQTVSMCVDDFPSSSLIGEQEPRPQTPPAAPTSPQFALYLSDNKTRHMPTLPPHEDTLGTRLQLMFYHRLLTGLLLPPGSDGALDFDALWKALGLSPTRQFSSKFKQEANLGTDACSLAGLQVLLEQAVDVLAIEGISNMLTLVYRRQHTNRAKKVRKSKKAKKSPEAKSREVATDVQATDLLAKSDSKIAELHDPVNGVAPVVQPTVDNLTRSEDPVVVGDAGPSTVHGTSGVNGFGYSDRMGSPDPSIDLEIQWAIQASLLHHSQKDPTITTKLVPDGAESSSESSSGDESSSSGGSSNSAQSGSIIGTKAFTMDWEMLDNYLTDILRWWYGKRKPHGVDVNMTRRCLSCEYREDCEWRESKANEAMMKAHRAGTS